MLRNQTSPWATLLVVLALAACGERDARAGEAPPAESGAPASTASGDPAPEGTAPGRVEATLSKAPFAGMHTLSGDLACTAYNGMWQAVLEQQGATGLSGVLVMLKDVPASGGTTEKLTLNLAFGPGGDDINSAVVDLHGAETGGDARGSVTREGGGAVLRVDGTTLAGARGTVVVRCGSVSFLQ
jgi:hypothetical protein